ncbi:AFG1 family mitochondrial ATPase [Salix suchowensis]|nr:AFG1 family mitochondrial ATPase [Salix suchowensis]
MHRSDYRRVPRALSKAVEDLGKDTAVPKSTSTVAWFEFDRLCGQPLSAADYIEVARVFETVFVVGIPKMGLSQKDMVRYYRPPVRFWLTRAAGKEIITFIDEVPVTQVFSDDASNDAAKPISDHMRSVVDDLVRRCRPTPHSRNFFNANITIQGLTSHAVGSSSIFTGEEEVFAFARACSRLVQMGSKEWVEMAGTCPDVSTLGHCCNVLNIRSEPLRSYSRAAATPAHPRVLHESDPRTSVSLDVVVAGRITQ